MNEMRVIDVPRYGARPQPPLASGRNSEYMVHTFMLRVDAIYTITLRFNGGAKMLFR